MDVKNTVGMRANKFYTQHPFSFAPFPLTRINLLSHIPSRDNDGRQIIDNSDINTTNTHTA